MTEKALFDPVVIALYEARTGEVYNKEIAKRYAKSWGRLQSFAAWMFDNLDEVTPENIRGFYAAWYRNNPNLTPPEKQEVMAREWASYLFSFRNRSPESRMPGPASPADTSWRERQYPTPDEVFADNPEVLARIQNAADNFANKMRKPSDRAGLTREDTRDE